MECDDGPVSAVAIDTGGNRLESRLWVGEPCLSMFWDFRSKLSVVPVFTRRERGGRKGKKGVWGEGCKD